LLDINDLALMTSKSLKSLNKIVLLYINDLESLLEAREQASWIWGI